MKVKIRHIDLVTPSDCGDMSPRELQEFVSSLRSKGITTSSEEGTEIYSEIETLVQYYDTGDEFFAEIVWYFT